MVKRVEAILDAICDLNGGLNPDSEAYRLRNPLLVESFANFGRHEIDDKGRRKFDSFVNGYKAGLFDLEVKLKGHSRARLNSESPLEDLLRAYRIVDGADVDKVIEFIRRAIRDQSVSTDTPLQFFLEG